MNCAGEAILPIPGTSTAAQRYLFCAASLLTLVKNTLSTRTLRYWALFLAIHWAYMVFNALIIHALRTNGIELKKLATAGYAVDFQRHAGGKPAAVRIVATYRYAQAGELGVSRQRLITRTLQ